MLKTKFAIILDTVIISLITFFISFIWINKYIKNAILSFILCTLISIAVFFAIFHIAIKKHKLKNLNNADLKKAELCFTKLTFLDEDKYKNYFENLFSCKFVDSNIFVNNNNIFYIETRRTLNAKDFIVANNYYLKNESKSLYFICQTADTEFVKLLDNSPVKYELYIASDLYSAIKTSGLYPDNIMQTNNVTTKFNKVKTLKNKFISSITRNHFKDFFISGISLVTISLFIPYSIYYMVMGSLLLLLAIISIFIKNKNGVITNKVKLTDLAKKNDA